MSLATDLVLHDTPIGRLLALHIDRVFEMPAELQALSNSSTALQEQIDAQCEDLAHLHRKLDQLLNAVRTLVEKQQLLEEASKNQSLLSEEHYQRHIVEPLARHLFPLTDLAEQAQSGQFDSTSQSNIINGIHGQLLDLLSDYGCEAIESSHLAPFDPSYMRPVETRSTPIQEKDQTVATSLQRGFRNGNRVLRPESVILYQYTENRRSNQS